MKKGFTLIELMIVIAIIAILAAIAIPNLMESRIRANEANAIAGIKEIATAQVQYEVGAYNGIGKYASSLDALMKSSNNQADLINPQMADSSKPYQGYIFDTATDDNDADFGACANAYSESTGKNNFYVGLVGTVWQQPSSSKYDGYYGPNEDIPGEAR